ncbi:MAG: C40 family peptidase [Deferribacteraceae bacterium]|nr:C40 family peptidase [Deferribacteraceae bacterium]
MSLLICYGCAPVSEPVTAYQQGAPAKNQGKKSKSGQKSAPTVKSSSKSSTTLETMGYTIQAGAFRVPENAAALTEKLDGQGIDPYFFKDQSGLYKVRFGNFKTRDEAQKYVKLLQSKKIISEYYIVSPSEYTSAQVSQKGTGYLRDELVKSAEKYIDVPYKWGGTGQKGIDCSGLTQAVYNLNGLSIPRSSGEQFTKGSPVDKKDLQKGDMVFFATRGGKRVSHVGIYIGDGNFIHAPSKGKKVCVEKLSAPYFLKTYVGARSYV